jgi:hypothetical protein
MSVAGKRYAAIGCGVFTRELAAAAARSPNLVDIRFLPANLHSQGGKPMAREIQAAIDALPAEGYDAVILGYALCNNGIIGLQARHAPLVAMRSHDCIACLLGSSKRFTDEHAKAPGTYWLSIGWIERFRGDASDWLANAPKDPPADDPTWQRMLEKYGEDNARYLWDEMQAQCRHYERLAYIDTGVGPQEGVRAEAARRAASQGWKLEVMPGDTAWIEALVNGPWDEGRFLVVPPGSRIVPRYDGSLIGAEA